MVQSVVILPSEEFKKELAREIAELVLTQIYQKPIPLKKNDEFLTTREVLRILQISPPTLRKLRKTGKVKTYGEGTHHLRFKRSEIEEALAKR